MCAYVHIFLSSGLEWCCFSYRVGVGGYVVEWWGYGLVMVKLIYIPMCRHVAPSVCVNIVVLNGGVLSQLDG